MISNIYTKLSNVGGNIPSGPLGGSNQASEKEQSKRPAPSLSPTINLKLVNQTQKIQEYSIRFMRFQAEWSWAHGIYHQERDHSP